MGTAGTPAVNRVDVKSSLRCYPDCRGDLRGGGGGRGLRRADPRDLIRAEVGGGRGPRERKGEVRRRRATADEGEVRGRRARGRAGRRSQEAVFVVVIVVRRGKPILAKAVG
jgi:hypothetical protein